MNIKDYEIFKTPNHIDWEHEDKKYKLNTNAYLSIVLGDHCNKHCKFCVADLIHKKQKLNISKIEKHLDFCIERMGIKEVLILGGEPTIFESLFDVIKMCKGKGFEKIIMTTNGIKLIEDDFQDKLANSGLTHCNISVMNFGDSLTEDDLGDIYLGLAPDIHIRINTNVYKNNLDSSKDIIAFYKRANLSCDSIKFSPLLKVDSFSVVNEKRDWVNNNILSDKDYEKLFTETADLLQKYHGLQKIENTAQFGFVKNVMIPLDVPIIFNHNHYGKMMDRAVNHNEINNIKLLPTGDLSLSWNREIKEYFINTK
jgi:molybdenum cofactor biosynthesis enzyme MoaA